MLYCIHERRRKTGVFNPDQFLQRRTTFSSENFGPADQNFQDQNSRDMPTDRQTDRQTDKQTDRLISYNDRLTQSISLLLVHTCRVTIYRSCSKRSRHVSCGSICNQDQNGSIIDTKKTVSYRLYFEPCHKQSIKHAFHRSSCKILIPVANISTGDM